MPTTATPSVLSGIGVPYALEADLTASTLGQAGPVAGRPELTEDAQGRRPALALSASGAQSSTDTLNIVTQRAGSVGVGGYRRRKTVSGVADTYWMGAHLPNLMVGQAFPGWAAIANQAVPHAVTLPDDTQVIVYRQTSGLAFNIAADIWDPATETYSGGASVVTGLDASHNPSPCLVVMPDPHGSSNSPILLCFYWVANDTTNKAQIDVSYSRDGGTTWSLWASSVLATAIDINSGGTYYTLGRLRGAMIGSNIALWAHLTANTGTRENVFQYASANAGAAFVEIGSIEGGYPDAVTVEQMAWFGYAQTGGGASLIPVTNAFVLVNTSEEFDSGINDLSIFSTTFSYGSFALSYDADRLYCHAVSVSADRRFGHSSVILLRDLSVHDMVITTHGVTWWDDDNSTATEFPLDICSTVYRGQVRIYCVMESATGTFDDRLTRIDLGGHTTITMPLYAEGDPYIPWAWDWTTMPCALASAFGATFTGAGTRSISTNTGWETLTTAAAQAYYTRNPTATADEEIVELIRVQVDSGGGVTSRVVACGLRAAGVGYGFEFELRFSTTQIRFRDVGGASDETTVTVDTTAGVDVLMVIKGDGTASAWYRSVGSDEEQYFQPIEVGFALTDDAGAGGTSNVVMWGNRATGTATTRWIELGGNAGTNLGTGSLSGGLTLPDDLRAIPYSSRSYAGGGVYLRASAGPALVGDTYTVRPDAEHPIRYLLPVGDEDSSVNVRGGQRTSSVDSAASWWALSTTGYVQARFAEAQNRLHPALVFVHVEGLNAPDPLVRFYDYDAAAYVTMGTMSNTRTGLRFSRSGASSRTVRVDTSGTSTNEPYCRSGSLKGSYWRFSVGGKVRPILDNTEGRWSNDADAAPIVLTLGGIDGTEPTSGTAGTIIYSRATFIVAMTATLEYGAFALQWSSAPDIYESQIRCSVLSVGQVEPLLYAASWGTEYRLTDPADLYESESGIRRSRKVRNGPRRVLTVPLGVLWDQRPIVAPTQQTPIVFKAYSNPAYPVAGAVGDQFGKLLGAWRRAGGSQHPVVWLPRIGTSAATQTLIGEEAGFYSRITQAPSFTKTNGMDTGAASADVWISEPWVFEEER